MIIDLEIIKELRASGMIILPGSRLVVPHEGKARGLINKGFAKELKKRKQRRAKNTIVDTGSNALENEGTDGSSD